MIRRHSRPPQGKTCLSQGMSDGLPLPSLSERFPLRHHAQQDIPYNSKVRPPRLYARTSSHAHPHRTQDQSSQALWRMRRSRLSTDSAGESASVRESWSHHIDRSSRHRSCLSEASRSSCPMALPLQGRYFRWKAGMWTLNRQVCSHSPQDCQHTEAQILRSMTQQSKHRQQ